MSGTPHRDDTGYQSTEANSRVPSGPVRPLRGRVVLRPLYPIKIGLIHLPGMTQDWERESQRDKGIRAMSSHRGRVLAMGAPAYAPDGRSEVPHGFEVGDEVVFIWRHNEREYTRTWTDGEPCCWVAQEHVQAVMT